MITDYTSRKNDVLSLYNKFNETAKSLKENAEKIKMPDPLKSVESLLLDIRNKAKKIKEDRFCIMVAGEAKSGKSTFINAYLGVELLPMDVKQCTSAIIEIKYGNKFSVCATYADGQQININSEAEAKEFLKKNAALDDNYRDIPVPTINTEIIVKSGLRSKEKGKNIHIQESDINDFLNATEVKEANIYNLSEDEYTRKIKKYIKEKKDNWQNIITKIEVKFPFSDEMKGIEIIDTPGICALGGVAEITSKNIENADAIIFLKPISGQAIESTQFNQFMKNNSVKRNKDALFLVFTRITNITPDDLRRLEDEAYKQFNHLDKRNILFVDSKAELYAKHFESIDDTDIKNELRRLNNEGTLDDFVVASYSDTNGIFGQGDFKESLHDKSRFSKVYSSLDSFGRKAHYLLLESLLNSISNCYTKIESDLTMQIDLFLEKTENPTELKQKIIKIKDELEIIENKMRKGVGLLEKRFLGDEGIVRIKADEAAQNFEEQVSLIELNSGNPFEELKNLSMDNIRYFQELTYELQKEVVSGCDAVLVEIIDKNTIPFESLKPDFTDEIFDEIYANTKEKSTEKQAYEDGITFTHTRYRSVYSRQIHFDTLKNDIQSRLENIKNDLVENVESFIEKITEHYINELSKNSKLKKYELDSIMEAKETAEQRVRIIEKLKEIKNFIVDEKSEITKIKGGIKNNVH